MFFLFGLDVIMRWPLFLVIALASFLIISPSLGRFWQPQRGRFYRFILGCAANYCVSVFFIWFFVLIGFNEYLSGFFAVAPVAVFLFVLINMWFFTVKGCLGKVFI